MSAELFEANTLAAEGAFLYVADVQGELTIYDLSDPGREAVRERRATLERLWADAAEVVR